MRMFVKNFIRDHEAAIGIGAMIVFIAMVLVAGIAASVLVSTSNTVQIQALSTGQKTQKEVSSGLSVFEVSGWVRNETNGTELENISRLAVVVKTRPGSDDIDLNNTYILLSNGGKKALLRYNYTNSSDAFKDPVSGDMFTALTDAGWNTTGTETFAIGVLQDEDDSLTATNPVLNRGDKAILYICTNTSYLFDEQLPPRNVVFGRVIPEIGSPGVISFTTPMTYVDQIYKLQ
ncbi:MAG: flagellin [Candidatus Thermoplasmatota archaeon]|nr:flagellin [Candidatus Thermoplasmatota archaeon]